MNLIEFRIELNSQMRSRNKENTKVLRKILGDIDNAAKLGSVDVVSYIKREIKRNKETMQQSGIKDAVLLRENDYLQTLLPKQLTQDEVSDILATNEPNNIGEAMKIFKTDYNGLYDGAMVSKMVKDYLK